MKGIISVILYLLIFVMPKVEAQSNIHQLKLSFQSGKSNNKSIGQSGYSSLIESKSKEEKVIPKIYKPWTSTKHFGHAIGELGIVQIIPWTFTRYLTHFDNPGDNWAKVGFKSWGKNISSGWEYDEDAFETNYFAHPYHGNLYFSVGRANGYDFGESALWSFSGSAMWEYFGETKRPSINDWINTSVNGITLGEITYRLATYVTDNTATGGDRVIREIAGALINPVRGFSRLISGEASRVFPNPDWRKPKNFYLLFNSGFRQLDREGDEIVKEGIQEGIFDFDVHYNNGLTRDLDVPFSSINFSVSLSSGSPNLTELNASGNLYGWLLKQNAKTTHILNVSLRYNYYHTPLSVYGGTSIIPHWISVFKLNEVLDISTSVGANIVLMGATPNDYYENEEGRDYDFGPGIGNYIVSSIRKGIWDLVRVIYQGQWLWTQSEPGHSKHHLHALWVEVQYPLTDYFAIGVGAGAYWKESYYDDYDDITINVPMGKVFFKTAIF